MRGNSQKNRFLPRLEAMESRVTPSVTTTAGSNGTVLIRGDSADDTVQINRTDAGQVTVVSGTGTGRQTQVFNDVQRIVVRLDGGNDTLTGNLGNLAAGGRLQVDVRTGAGNDAVNLVFGNLGRDARLDLDVVTDGGDDEVDFTFGNISRNARADVDVLTGAGTDDVDVILGNIQRGARVDLDVLTGAGADTTRIRVGDVERGAQVDTDVDGRDARRQRNRGNHFGHQHGRGHQISQGQHRGHDHGDNRKDD